MQFQWLQRNQVADILPALKEIFFLSADPRNVTADAAKNEAFFQKWTAYYLEQRPEWILVAKDKGKLLAYLMCEPDSRKALSHFEKINPSYRVFEDQFAKFPAHLHMNAHPEARGRGVGSQLIDHLVEKLKGINAPGVHLITSPSQRNASFYRKNGFTEEVRRDWKGYPLLFMGRKI